LRALRVALGALLLWAGAAAPDLAVDLGRASWTRNGVSPSVAPRVTVAADKDGDGRALVSLPCDDRGVRWATTFETGAGRMARLTLDWNGAPDGLLFEVVVDGQRLQPSRDAWRPSPRALRTDLGSLWLGPGGHLFEIVAREQPVAPSAVHLAALEVEWLGS
jgi:hypothetical protein